GAQDADDLGRLDPDVQRIDRQGRLAAVALPRIGFRDVFENHHVLAGVPAGLRVQVRCADISQIIHVHLSSLQLSVYVFVLVLTVYFASVLSDHVGGLPERFSSTAIMTTANLRKLSHVVALGKYGTFAQAADAVHLSQPAF